VKGLRFLILFSASWFIVGGVEAQPTLSESGDPTKGKIIYETNCVICHGERGKGDGLLGATLRPPPTDLTGPVAKAKSDMDLRTVILEGRGVMPAWKTRLKEQDIQNVLAYIRSLGK
jgi:mono/diheme cytochrome c family protein